MIINKIKITNFKSIYGTQEFNFQDLNGLIKLSGPIGAGKTTIAEAVLWGLYGTVKGQNNGHLVAWNTKTCEIELFLTSKNKEVHIIRNSLAPLVIEIDGKVLPASNKKGSQAILEEEIYDVPKLAITKMCVISFNAFNSLADMSPAETKQFLDEIFGFKLFSDYNWEIVQERKNQQNEATKLRAIYEDTQNQINRLEEKKLEQQNQIADSIDLQKLSEKRKDLVKQGIDAKSKYQEVDKEYKQKEFDKDKERLVFYNKKMEYATLGKQHKEWIKKFDSGICPTCGHEIDESIIEEHKSDMTDCAKKYREQETLENEKQEELTNIKSEHQTKLNELTEKMNSLRKEIGSIDQEVSKYNNAIQLISENYDDLISEYELKNASVKEELDKVDIEVGEWNEMNELFTKTLRYNLLETLIPHINKSIQYFINKLDQTYKIQYDQEFKPHIFVDTYDREIAYNNLSTGQRKTLDLAIIFGILQNVIASVNFNVFVLDELFSNMDADARNVMLSLLNESLSDGRSVFVINHAEMQDDYFKHKIRVYLQNKKIEKKGRDKEEVIVRSSKYEQVF